MLCFPKPFSLGMFPFFHFALCLFAKIAFCAVQTTKDKLTFRKIENIQLWHFVPFVAQKRNSPNLNNFSCIYTNLPNACPKEISMIRRQEMGFYVSFHHRKMMLNVFLCAYMYISNITFFSAPSFSLS